MNLIEEYLLIINYFKSISFELWNSSILKKWSYKENIDKIKEDINKSNNYLTQEKKIKSFLKKNNSFLVNKDFFYKIKIIEVNFVLKKVISIFLWSVLNEKWNEKKFNDLINEVEQKVYSTHNFLSLNRFFNDILNDRILRNTIEHNNIRGEIWLNVWIRFDEVREYLYFLKSWVNKTSMDKKKKEKLNKEINELIEEFLWKYKTDFKITYMDFDAYIVRSFSFISLLFLIKSELEDKEEYEVIKVIYINMLNWSESLMWNMYWDSARRHLPFLYWHRRMDFYKKSIKEIVDIIDISWDRDVNKIII